MGLPPEVFNPSGTVVKLNDEQTAKLNSELDIVDSNVQVLNEILAELEKSSDQSDKDLSLLIVALFSYNSNLINFMNYIILYIYKNQKELNKTCREMQKRVTQLIGNISNENVIGELLRVNDDLNNVFLRYERFERTNGKPGEHLATTVSVSARSPPNSKTTPVNNYNNQASVAAAAAATSIKSNVASATTPVDKPLIDFNDEFDDTVTKKPSSVDLLNSNMKSLNLNKKSDDEFTDMNAVRNTFIIF